MIRRLFRDLGEGIWSAFATLWYGQWYPRRLSLRDIWRP